MKKVKKSENENARHCDLRCRAFELVWFGSSRSALQASQQRRLQITFRLFRRVLYRYHLQVGW